MSVFRRFFIYLFCVGICGCANPNRSPKDTITTIIDSPAQSLNPLYATDAATQHINELLHASLVSVNDQLVPEPYLAEEFHYEGKNILQFTLRRNCRFPDGAEITTDDVEKSLAYYTNKTNESPFADSAFKSIVRFERLSARQFRLHTDKPAPGLLSDLELLKILQLSGVPAGQKPKHIQGAGPYQLKSFSNSLIELEQSRQPCLPIPATPKISVKVVRDDLARYLKLKLGEIDVVMNEMNFRKVERIQQDSSLPLRVLAKPGVGYSYLGLNLTSPNLRDQRVREALALSFDIPSLIRYKSRGMALPARNLLADQNYYANLGLPVIHRDLERARTLLDSAGYFDGKNGKPPLHLVLKTNTNLISVENAKVLVAQAKEAGIILEHKAYDWGIFYNDVKTGNTEVYLLRYVGVTDPRIYFELFHSKEIGRGNRTRYNNPLLDPLLEKAESELVPAARRDIYAKVQEILAKDLPLIGLWYPSNVVVYRDEVKNVSLHPKGSWKVFAKMRKE